MMTAISDAVGELYIAFQLNKSPSEIYWDLCWTMGLCIAPFSLTEICLSAPMISLNIFVNFVR